MTSHRQIGLEGVQRDTRRLDAFARHQKMVHDYIRFYGGKVRPAGWKPPVELKTDADILRENHRFIRSAEEDAVLTWEKRLAKKYYDKLFKEYAIADLSMYKDGKIGFRWRIEKEVLSGKGQFSCGARKCVEYESLESFEVDFAYVEAGETKAALVKLRVCPECARKLNYKHAKRRAKQTKKLAKKQRLAASHVADDQHARTSTSSAAGSPARQGGCDAPSSASSRERNAEPLAAAAAAAAAGPEPESVAANPWAAPRVAETAVSQENEFDEYFDDLFN